MRRSRLSHFTRKGASTMVDVGAKAVTSRFAVAEAVMGMAPATLATIRSRKIAKGDVFEVARLAGIMAAKQVPALIPLCHPIALTKVTIDFAVPDRDTVVITVRTEARDRTGVEMEAMTAASVAALTVYDMCKAIDRGIEIRTIRLLEKAGGKSGHFMQKRKRGGR
jgi:cyclic pyranopterin phosphate synthase